MSTEPVRIGTRSSPLAMWQAKWVARLIQAKGLDTTIVRIDSAGDQDGTQPLYEMNIQGIFTKALDQALLDDRIDIAVHSFKDVPTQLPKGIELAAVLERGAVSDILVFNQAPEQWPYQAVIGTSSLRRSAQWKNQFPNHQTAVLRGNVHKRMQTLSQKDWIGALFALAGLERAGILPTHHLVLDWMLPAPAQGAVCVVINTKQPELKSRIAEIGCPTTHKATQQERHFLRMLEGGCTAPIGALVTAVDKGWYFKGGVFSVDGRQKSTLEQFFPEKEWEKIGDTAAKKVLENGGAELMKAFRN